MVEAFPENEDALLIYSVIRWQTCTTEIGDRKVIDVNISAVKDTMEMLNIKYEKSTFLKVLKLFHYFINQK